MTTETKITATELIERYDALLIDAYGVLVHQKGAFPHASAFIQHLNDTKKPYFIVTNDASKLPEKAAASYMGRGITAQLSPERIITSGSLLIPYFKEHGLQGARCVVLGPEGSQDYVRLAGGEIVSPHETDDIDVVAVCDDAGFPFLETVEATMSVLFRRFDAGKHTHLLLPNPDLIYQKNETNFGFTSGSISLLLEHALQLRYLHEDHSFTRLGKPHTPIFEQAFQRTQTRNMVMIGDQLRTDIAGANAFGIDSALISTGLVVLQGQELPDAWQPTYLFDSLAL
ncbi:MAG: HAD hydrolase-like protein [Myxococcales bacterium]|nr:HAD hydrolase-like protein [Myxococcales bacterium]